MQDTLTGLWALFGSAFISATIAPGGSEAVLAYMVSQGSYPDWQLLSIATLANTLGAMTTWWLGWMVAKKVPVASQLSQKQQRGLQAVKEKGAWVLLFSWLPVIGDGFCFAGGWLRLPLLPAFLAILIGKFGRYAVITWLFN
ncbi:YqaA family protein [Crenothrix sp.]|uniref:YqaA family protein n=1 Tax=Crenothrix sp. TaxID=3100433 RepID=UPI00374DA6D6